MRFLPKEFLLAAVIALAIALYFTWPSHEQLTQHVIVVNQQNDNGASAGSEIPQ